MSQPPAPRFVPFPAAPRVDDAELIARAAAFRAQAARRRTLRDFAPDPVPREAIEQCLLAAGSAPSGANLQPWTFVAIADPSIKQRIRIEAEAEEREFYAHRAPPEWLAALAPLGTDERKPFLESAPWLIAIFAQSYGVLPDGRKVKQFPSAAQR